jgi:alkaline phosphatase
MAVKLTRMTHIIAIQLQLVAESCTICSSRSRRPVRKLLDTHSYIGPSPTEKSKSNEVFERKRIWNISFRSCFHLQTYCVDSQVADSACSATAYLGGVKANTGTVGVTAKVKLNDCVGMRNSSNQVTSILKWSQVMT